MLSQRIQKAVLVACMSFYLILVVLGNTLDSNANFIYIEHVLSMDTVFENSTQKWRAITNPELWRLGFVLILVYQILIAIWLGWAAVRIVRTKKAADWPATRAFASAAVVTTMLLWMVPFLIIGGEWFQMWQSTSWNGVEAATRNFTVHGIVLLYLQTDN